MRSAILQRSISMGKDFSGFWPSTTHRRKLSSSNSLRRVGSDTDVISVSLRSCGERCPPPAFFAAVEEAVSEEIVAVKENEEVEYSGGSGRGKGSKSMGGSFGEENKGNQVIDNYYQDMLRADPGNGLLLRNYGRFLHEVKGDLKKAEDYYGRAILGCPGDGELLSLYARLIWDSERDCKRAEGYHKLAVEASPDDSYVLGSYAHFLWDADEGEEEGMLCSSSPSILEAF